MKPELAAGLAVLEEVYDGLIDVLGPLDESALTWQPLAAKTNAIAGLVRHTVGATNNWLGHATGEEIPRDRDSEFQARAAARDLIALIESSRIEARRRLALLDSADLGRVIDVRRESINQNQRVTLAWCVQHAVGHAWEHWGQIQLTRQLYLDQRG